MSPKLTLNWRRSVIQPLQGEATLSLQISLISVSPFVDYLAQTLNLRFDGAEQREIHRDKRVSIRPAKRQHTKAFVVAVSGVILESR